MDLRISEHYRIIVVGAILGLLIFVGLGFLAGGPIPRDDPPELDFSEPKHEVAADAIEQLQYRDHTAVTYKITTNRTTNYSKRRIGKTIRVQHSKRRAKLVIHLTQFDGGNVTLQVFQNRYRSWAKQPGEAWETIKPGAEIRYRQGMVGGIIPEPETHNVAAALDGTNWSVFHENTSVLQLRTTDERAIDVIDSPD